MMAGRSHSSPSTARTHSHSSVPSSFSFPSAFRTPRRSCTKPKPGTRIEMRARTPSNTFSTPQLVSTTLLLLLPLLLSFTISLASADPSPTTIQRRGHTGTLIQDTVYFVGGIGSSAASDSSPLKSVSALDLNALLFTETLTSLAIYNHAATSNITLTSSTNYIRIGVGFGQYGDSTLGDALQWLDPSTGLVTPGGDSVTGASAGAGVGSGVLTGRVGHSMVQFGNNLWVFGGRTISALTGTAVAPAMVPVADTPTFDLSAGTWSTRTKGLQRYGHASARAGIDRIVTCYGINSTSASAALDADCVYFSISTAVYTPAQIVWTNPADAIQGGRTGHSLVSSVPSSHILYLFGGMNTAGTQYFQDVYQLDTSKMPTISITKIAAAATSLVPSARSEHAAVAVGTETGFMIVHGGVSGSNNNLTMASAGPYIFSMGSNAWINGTVFATLYQEQIIVAAKNVSVAVIIVGILAGVSVLGAGVAFYIWKGLRDDELERQKNEATENQPVSPTFSTMDDSLKGRKRGADRQSHSVYPLGAGEEDHSLATGPFKSTSSLIQAEEAGKKPSRKNHGDHNGTDAYQSNRAKPRGNGEPYSPGGTTLTENGSMNGYISSSASSSTPTRLNKNNSNGSSSHYSNRQTTAAANAANGGTSVDEGSSSTYYNPRDLYVDENEDDDSSITVSLASESTMGSPWAGPVRMSMDLAPPNPRFSRGAISQAHRQLVGAITTNHSAVSGNRNSQGWDTGSPGGSLSSRDDSEHHRRSVNSMQWVSFDPQDLSGRPESGVYDPLSQRSLTVRNASMYGPNRGSLIQSHGSFINTQTNNNNPRMSMFGGSNSSDTNTEDSGSYYSGPDRKQVSAALAARQQRRSMRNSRDSQLSASAKYSDGSTLASASGVAETTGVTEAGSSGETGDVMVTRVLPIITTKITRPTVAKVISNPRGPRIVIPSERPSGERSGAQVEEESDGSGLGIDFSAFTAGDSYGGGKSRTTNMPGFTNAAAYQARRSSSTLNPSYNRNNNGTSTVTGATPPAKRESRLSLGQRGDIVQPNVVLREPPLPTHDTNGVLVRDGILEPGQDMPGLLNYGDNNMEPHRPNK